MKYRRPKERDLPTGRSGRTWCHIAKTTGNAAMDIVPSGGAPIARIEEIDLAHPVPR
jgi:hypothetical protein